ncbi:MAG: hypothetical protein WB626_02960 [Bacteroidota bacterium]
MNLLRTKPWPPLDIALLKTCCLLAGMMAGAYVADFTRENIWVFALGAVLTGIKPAVSYFLGGKD